MDISLLRKLAKSSEYQDLYSLCKEIRIPFFENEQTLTPVQILFLKYVCFYYSIYMDISLGEVSEIVLDNEVYEDSYSLYKNRKDSKRYKNTVSSTTHEQNVERTNKWLFKSPRKK